MARLDVRPEAELDAEEAGAWYDGEQGGLGTEFLPELRATLVRILAITHVHRHPGTWQSRQ